MTLQLNVFLSESESLPFINIVIFNSQPKADHKVFTGVCQVVFTGAPQQGSECVGSNCPGQLHTACCSRSWLLQGLPTSEVLGKVKVQDLWQNTSDKSSLLSYWRHLRVPLRDCLRVDKSSAAVA